MQSIRIRKYKPNTVNTEYKPNTNQILTEYVPGLYWVCIGAQIQTKYCNTYQYAPEKPLMVWRLQALWPLSGAWQEKSLEPGKT